jgi:hypothetical protein
MAMIVLLVPGSAWITMMIFGASLDISPELLDYFLYEVAWSSGPRFEPWQLEEGAVFNFGDTSRKDAIGLKSSEDIAEAFTIHLALVVFGNYDPVISVERPIGTVASQLFDEVGL